MLEKEVLIHDLNNLLTVISSTAELLKIELNNKIPSKSINKLDSLLVSSQKASELIRNYKTGNGKQRRTDLKAYLTEFQKFVAALTEKHSIKFNLTFDNSADYYVYLNPADLDEITTNLFKNAVEALTLKDPKKNERKEITISISKEVVESLKCDACNETFSGEYIVFEIQDTGPGIRSPQCIFDYGYTTKKGSSGVGLYAVKFKTYIAYGHITVDTSNQGTTFKIYLPSESKVRPEPLPLTPPLLNSLRGNVLLLVKDDNLLRSFLEILKDTSLRIVDDALKFSPESIDLVIYENPLNGKILDTTSRINNKYPFAQILYVAEIPFVWDVDGKIFCISKSIDKQNFLNLLGQILK